MAKKRNNMQKTIESIDLSYARSAKLMLPVSDRLRLCLVGCGGTGSWLAPSVARIARLQRDQGREVEVVFYDHDHVEPKNIPRQHFCDAELGRNKAVTLAPDVESTDQTSHAHGPDRLRGQLGGAAGDCQQGRTLR